MTTEFAERNAEMVRLYNEERRTLQEIGDVFGVSRERVRQILGKDALNRPRYSTRQRCRDDWIGEHRANVSARMIAGESQAKVMRAEGVPLDWIQAIWNDLTDEERRIGRLRAIARARHEVPDEQLLDYLRSAAAKLGEPLTTEAYDRWRREWGAYGHLTIVTRFGSWNRAIELAGLTPNPSSQVPRQFSNEECLGAVRRVEEKLGRIPSVGDYHKHRLPTDPSAPLVRVRFDGWLGTLRALGKDV